ncbi:hypothetical protein IAT38_003161 [Cryptococcus sp. DSM 104549]
MAPKTRQRTAAQRKPKPEEDASLLSTADIADEQEQENEITYLRTKNDADNRQAQNALDVGVIISVFITIIQLQSHFPSQHPIFPLLAGSQLLLLPFSLTPHWLPSRLRPYLQNEQNHILLLSFQFIIALCALYLRSHHGGAGGKAVEMGEIARWGLPALVVGAVEMQRRGERESEGKLKMLESMRYNVKGA